MLTDAYTFPLLQHLGIEAYLLPHKLLGNLIVIETLQYEQHHHELDRWFFRVREHRTHSYFQLRLRGATEMINAETAAR